MNDSRILLYVLVTLIFVGLVGLLGGMYGGNLPVWEFLDSGGFRLAYLMSLIVLAAHSTIFKSWTAFLVIPALVVGVVGTLFKIMHWPLANDMLLLGGGLLPIAYTIRIVLKRPFNRQSVLKWLFVTTYCAVLLGLVFHWYPALRHWAFIPRVLLLVTTVDLLVTKGYLKPKVQLKAGEL
jgi:hypothetical protein